MLVPEGLARAETKVLDLQEEQEVALIGTLYKEQKLKPSILDEYTKARPLPRSLGLHWTLSHAQAPRVRCLAELVMSTRCKEQKLKPSILDECSKARPLAWCLGLGLP